MSAVSPLSITAAAVSSSTSSGSLMSRFAGMARTVA
jgi:hypothetical protein